jgi:hypothetical protein
VVDENALIIGWYSSHVVNVDAPINFTPLFNDDDDDFSFSFVKEKAYA